MFIIKDLKFTKKIFYSFFLISLLPQIIISKEKDNSIVPKKKEKIISSINRLKRSMTIIFIAHRLSTIKECDKIFHIENGKLRNQGSFSELTNNDDLFQQMAAELL